jgi:hypothetical protein
MHACNKLNQAGDRMVKCKLVFIIISHGQPAVVLCMKGTYDNYVYSSNLLLAILYSAYRTLTQMRGSE